MNKPTVDDIDSLLPQTQCQECGYLGCRPYARAIVEQGERLDKCPPGGVETLHQLGRVLGRDVSALEPSVGSNTRAPAVAFIREEECIGCTKCIQACPVDAIVGAAKLMHTVIENDCTGCRLCVEPCPVDCIDIIEFAKPRFDKDLARIHFEKKNNRLIKEKKSHQQKHDNARILRGANSREEQKKAKQDYIKAALKRVQMKKKVP